MPQVVKYNRQICTDEEKKKIHDMCEGVRAKCDIMTAKAKRQIRREEEEVKRIKEKTNY